MTRYQCISADSHVIEPGNLWLDYIEPKYKSRAPHIVDKGDHDEFTCDGAELMPLGAVAAAGVAPDKITRQGRFATHVPRGGWDPQARMADLAKDGVEAEVVYPTMAMRLFAVKDQDFQRACFNAYNRWVVDFCKAYPHQLKAVGVVPTDDIETAVGELKHCGKLGLAGASIAIYQNPDKHYGDPVYDPLWASAQENDLPVSLHILTERNPKLKRDVSDGIVESQWIQRSLGLMAFSGVFERYPKLHIVSAENDIGWVPYFLERIDYLFDRRRNLYNMNIPRKEKPSETIKRAVFFTFMRDKAGVINRHLIGLDRILWSSDYPHNDSTYPRSQQTIDYLMEGVPQTERQVMIAENAARLYGFA